MEDKIFNYLQIEIDKKQNSLFEEYYNFLIEYNKHTNLTRIVDQEEVYIKHFLDSLLLARLIDFNEVETICDMGSGAGFPSIPLLIVFPNLKVTIVESQIKRVNFLNELKDRLNLNYKVVHDRAEVYAKEHRNKFDLVTARALGSLRMILEFGVPLLKINGYFIAPKGSKYKIELKESENALEVLHTKLIKIDEFELDLNMGFRANLLFQKLKVNNKYPREYQKIIKNPL